MTTRKLAVFGSAIVLCATLARAGVNMCTVDPVNGTDSTDDGNTAFATLNFAVANVNNGATIKIVKGTHVFTGPLQPNASDLTIEGADLDDPRATVLDGQQSPGGLSIVKNGTHLLGLVVSNCCGFVGGNGGGMSLTAPDTVVSNCVVTCCTNAQPTKTACGGGIYSKGADNLFYGVLIEKCAAVGSSSNKPNGGGGYFADAKLFDCTIRDCIAANVADAATGAAPYAGGAQFYEPVQAVNCKFVNNAVVDYKGKGGTGGCITTSGGKTYGLSAVAFTNCLFAGNSVPISGAAVHAAGGTRTILYACTITNNSITASNTGNGGTVILSTAGRLEKCLLCDNRAKNEKGGVVFFSGGTSGVTEEMGVYDCAILNNDMGSSAKGGGVCSINHMNDLVVSNCVISGNSCSSDTPSGLCCDTFERTVRVYDTIFSKNGSGAVRITSTSEPKTEEPSFMRQCIVRDNSGAPTISFKRTYGSFTLEGCTIVSNAVSGSNDATIYASRNEAYAANVYVKGCVFAGNSGGKGDFDAKFSTCLENFFSTCYMKSSLTLPAEQGNVKMTESPLVDEGSVLLKKGTAPVDIIKAEIPAWMQAAGAKDLGDGTHTMEKVMDYGVHIAFNKRRPRIVNTYPDAGACEYYPIPGLMLLLK